MPRILKSWQSSRLIQSEAGWVVFIAHIDPEVQEDGFLDSFGMKTNPSRHLLFMGRKSEAERFALLQFESFEEALQITLKPPSELGSCVCADFAFCLRDFH